MLIRQFFDMQSSSYTYLLASDYGHKAIIIDPVKEQLDQYLTAISELYLKLVITIDTHTHADHITASGLLREQTSCISLMGEFTNAKCVSATFTDNEIIDVDGIQLKAIYTPGHTDDSYSFILRPDQPYAVFTGDVLLIRGSGRTDFQNGCPAKSWDSVTNKLFTLPDKTLVYPAHDYKGWTVSSILEEKQHNPRFAGKTKAQYMAIMSSLNLASPKLMDIAVPANLACGL